MEVQLATSYNVAFDPSFPLKERIPLSVNIDFPNAPGQKDEATKRLLKLKDVFRAAEWSLIAEFNFYDEEGSPKLDVALEGELLQRLQDLFYYGSANESLNLSLTASVSAQSSSYNPYNRHRHPDHVVVIQVKDMAVDTGTTGKHFRYCKRNVTLPENWLHGNQWNSNNSGFNWDFLVELYINDLVDLDALLPDINGKMARMFKEKLFCDFEIISCDETAIPCHKAILSVNSNVFMAKCEGKLKEPSKDQMTMDVTTEGVNALLEFLYYGDVRKPLTTSSIALELFQAGHAYGISELERVTGAILLQKSYQWYDTDVALLLFQFLVNYEGEACVGLKEKVIQVLSMKADELEKSEVFQKMFKIPVASQMFALMAATVRKNSV